MHLYYQVDVFDKEGRFTSDNLLNMLHKNRKRFMLFFPRKCRLNEIVSFQKFLDRHKNLSFCIHDKNMLIPDNEIHVGRNVAFYTMLSDAGANIENVSFHMGSIIGFGTRVNGRHVDKLLTYNLPPQLEKERFLIADFDMEDYLLFRERAVRCLKNLRSLLHESGLTLLLKNFSLDHVVVNKDKAAYFYDMHYQHGYLEEKTYPFPVVFEKGDFPRTVVDLLSLIDECRLNLALDMEHLQNIILFSQKYNLQNEALLKEWRLPHVTPTQERCLRKYGFLVAKGYPILFEKPLELYELMDLLKNRIQITHLAGSLGPVFLDKYDMSEKDVTPEMLMGQLDAADRPYACLGKQQQIQFRQTDHPEVRFNDNFKNHAAQNVWQDLFSRQFLETILILKEIKCKRIVQKMKFFSEDSVETYEIFKRLSDLDDIP